MKKGLLLFVAALSIGFTSCDKIDEIENFAIDHKFEHSMDLKLADGDPTAFRESMVINMNSDEEFAKNLSKISNYSIKKLSLKVSNYVGDDANVGAVELDIYNAQGSSVGKIEGINVEFKKMNESGDEQEILIDDAMKTKIQDLLMANNSLIMYVQGAVTSTPMDAKLTLGVEVEAAVKVD